jgi:pimeloyl-ACP methyl ester carboxylesterase
VSDARETIRSTVRAADGRALEIAVAGPADGTPLFVLHGTPGAAGLFGRSIEAARERGLRLVAYSRPGYGGSDRHEGRSVADCAADVTAIADALGLQRFHTLGGSGGGPHSLACARLLPERVISAATIASGAPFDADGLDWTAGMGKENIDEFAAAQAGPGALQAFLEHEARDMAGITGADIVGGLGDLVSEVDARALTGDYGEYMAEQIGRSLSSGIWGWFDDDVAFVSDWGFDLAGIEVPVSIWHGGQDRFVPIAHGEWLAAHVAGARVTMRPGDGHLSLVTDSYGDVLDDLLAVG